MPNHPEREVQPSYHHALTCVAFFVACCPVCLLLGVVRRLGRNLAAVQCNALR
jgi:hypothetical protein